MKRFATQIIELDGYIHALANDGTIWQMGTHGWSKVDDLPQDDPMFAEVEPALPTAPAVKDEYLPVKDEYLPVKDEYLPVKDEYLPVKDEYLPGAVIYPLWGVQPGTETLRIDNDSEAIVFSDAGRVIVEAPTARAAEESTSHGFVSSEVFFVRNQAIKYIPFTPF